ncbi:unnamed protein product [Dimorphilus gyrociliatus]|uniref:Uncharacterized protein n=1 Tax=Dimorphilus gyrociliatus TaxID=2664684 RepID=A0A7I8VE28_9ANNE|nr:unnamed protein product [Dimorphilus gyrociliatus]
MKNDDRSELRNRIGPENDIINYIKYDSDDDDDDINTQEVICQYCKGTYSCQLCNVKDHCEESVINQNELITITQEKMTEMKDRIIENLDDVKNQVQSIYSKARRVLQMKVDNEKEKLNRFKTDYLQQYDDLRDKIGNIFIDEEQTAKDLLNLKNVKATLERDVDIQFNVDLKKRNGADFEIEK